MYGLSAQVVINEVCTNNISILVDEHKDYQDWIELYNPTDQIVDLTGWTLTDQPDSLGGGWTFPELKLSPKSYVLIYASKKDNPPYFHHWETVIKAEEEWQYIVPTETLTPHWLYPTFEAEDWKVGKGGFGCEDDDDNTIVETAHSFCIRKKFQINNQEEIARYTMHVDYDDAFVMYLNGREIARRNIGRRGKFPQFDDEPKKDFEARIPRDKKPKNVLFRDSIFRATLKPAGEDNLLAFQVFNYGTEKGDLTIRPYLSVAAKTTEHTYQPIPEWWSFPSPNLHCSFRLKKGETLRLINPEGKTMDSVKIQKSEIDQSWGRTEDGKDEWGIFSTPNPLLSNNDHPSFSCFASKPTLDYSSGFYEQGFQTEIKLKAGKKKSKEVRYTLDGSLPDETDFVLPKKLSIDSTSVVRLRSFEKDCLPSDVKTYNYFINDSTELAVVALASDPDNFFSDEKGIYVEGPEAEKEHPKKGANFWKEWEIPTYFEYFDKDRKKQASQLVGIQINGGGSRTKPMKSLRVCPRKTYGKRTLKAPFFEDRENTQFKRILLKNGGQSFGKQHIVDVVNHRVIRDLGTIDVQSYQPAVVFINGQYWGLHNIREKIGEDYLYENYGLDEDSLDIVGGAGTIRIHGKQGQKDFKEWAEFMKTSDLSDPENYQKFLDFWDVENFCDYFIAQIHLLNIDWNRVGNVKFWRSPEYNDHKFQYFLADTDLTMGRRSRTQDNHLNFVMTHDFLHFKLLRSALQNEGFKIFFLTRYLDLLNTTFAPERVIQTIDSFTDQIRSEMPRHSERWDLKLHKWEPKYIKSIKDFAKERPAYSIQHLQDTFFLQAPVNINITMEPADAGKVQINSTTLEGKDFPFTGLYWQDFDVNVVAMAKEGYEFSHWLLGDQKIEEFIHIFKPDEEKQLKAVFRRK